MLANLKKNLDTKAGFNSLDLKGGANHPSLMDCQSNFEKEGVSESRLRSHVRPSTESDVRDMTWRQANQDDLCYSRTPASLNKQEYTDLNVWYYWKRPNK